MTEDDSTAGTVDSDEPQPPRRDNTRSDWLVATHALVVQIQNQLLRSPLEQCDSEIIRALALLGGNSGSDRVYVFRYDGDRVHNTHEWCAPGIEPMIGQLQDMPAALLDPWKAYFSRGLPMHVPDVAALDPGSSLREILQPQGVRSLVAVPMRHGGREIGFVGFDSVRRKRAFASEEMFLLQSVADAIATLLIRREDQRSIAAAQRALEDERAFLRSILDTSLSGFIVFDADRRVIFANAAASAALGIPEAMMLGQIIADDIAFTTFDGTPVPVGALPFDIARQTGKPVRDIRMATSWRGGPRRMLSLNALAIGAPDAAGRRVVLSLEEISARAAAETAREEALEEARRATLAKSRFLARMSHEMRTPLNGVLGIADLLDDMIPQGDAHRLLNLLRDSGGLLVSIIDDLLDMSKIEADQLQIERIAFSPAALARQIEAVHTLRAAEKGISFRLLCDEGAARTRYGDPHRISQILHNLVSNALKFTEDGAVTIRLDGAGDEAIAIEVADTGIGMSAEDIARMFEEFGQADSSITRRFGGTGLGMTITRRLAGLMGGSLDVYSTPGQGTTVKVVLPLELADTDARPDADAVEEPAETAMSFDGLRVLAADDNRTNRLILEAMLRHLGCKTTLCAGGEDFLRNFAPGRFDLCILDISMPDVDGITALRRLRETEASAGALPVPVLAYTANAMLHQIGQYLEEGFDGCLTKPLRRDRLVSEIRRSAAPDRGGARHDLSA